MPQQFKRYKKLVDSFLLSFLNWKQKELSHVNTWSDDVFDKLKEFVVSGKTIRGSFVPFITEAYGKKINDTSLKFAAAVELIHSGFLIHDDIMDADRTRRGHPSMYAQYEEAGSKLSIQKSLLFGQDMALCTGDLTFFLAMSCFENPRLIKRISSEYSAVCLAQMQDVSFGFSHRIPTTDEILSLYNYKTARYTFSLPFIIGGSLAGIPKHEISNLEKLGEQMGIIFQLRDDTLNLFGNTKATGKPVGSDIREGKKTLALVYLFTHASNPDRQQLQMIMKLNSRKPADVAVIYRLFEKYQIKSYLETELHTLAEKARHAITRLSMSETNKKYMTDVLEYIYERSQ